MEGYLGDKPIPCDFLGAQFPQIYSLQATHMISGPLGEKPFMAAADLYQGCYLQTPTDVYTKQFVQNCYLQAQCMGTNEKQVLTSTGTGNMKSGFKGPHHGQLTQGYNATQQQQQPHHHHHHQQQQQQVYRQKLHHQQPQQATPLTSSSPSYGTPTKAHPDTTFRAKIQSQPSSTFASSKTSHVNQQQQRPSSSTTNDVAQTSSANNIQPSVMYPLSKIQHTPFLGKAPQNQSMMSPFGSPAVVPHPNSAQQVLSNLQMQSFPNVATSSNNDVPKSISSADMTGLQDSTRTNTSATNNTTGNQLLVNKPYQCTSCPKQFARRDTLQIHTRTHTGIRPYACEFCSKTFTQRDKLQIHRRTHTNERPYPCTLCPKRFSRGDKLKLHLRTHSGEKPFACDLCPKKFAQRDKLKIHARVHTGEKPYACDGCPKSFARRDKLQIHRASVHSGVRPHVCSECSRSFSQRDKLRLHMRTHTGERPFACHLCPKRFARSDTLHVHLRVHSGIRPHACDVCGRRFSQRDKLKVHQRTHTAERPYRCSICIQRFARKDTLRVHERTHSGARPYVCPVCGKDFVRADKLQRHKRTHTQLVRNNFLCASSCKSIKDYTPLSAHLWQTLYSQQQNYNDQNPEEIKPT